MMVPSLSCDMIRSMSGRPHLDVTLRSSIKDTAIEAARAAGAILQERARLGFRIEHKNAVNLVTDADTQAEQAIIERIREAHPEHQILAEEQGIVVQNDSSYKWVIDPLDGTTNFAHGFPAYCVSIGVEYQGSCILGVVFDPTRQELFVGETGGGAFLNDQRIRVSQTASLNAALVVTGFGYDIRETSNNNLDYFARFALRAQGIRRMGAAALDLCYVASGRLDGYWELKLHPWDTAAGVVIVEEAGGQVTDLQGNPYSIYGTGIVASNGQFHNEMVDVLRHG